MNFTVYSKDGCPHCSKIVQLLDLKEFKYVEYKLGRDFDSQGFFGQFGQGSTFPQVTVDGKNLGGCIDTISYLKQNNLV